MPLYYGLVVFIKLLSAVTCIRVYLKQKSKRKFLKRKNISSYTLYSDEIGLKSYAIQCDSLNFEKKITIID